MGNDITFACSRVVSPWKRALYITSIGWVISMNLGAVLVILSFLHRLVMLPVPMEPLSIPHVSQSCPSLHVKSMLSVSHHLPYALIRRKIYPDSFILQLSFLYILAIIDTVTSSCTSCLSKFFQII